MVEKEHKSFVAKIYNKTINEKSKYISELERLYSTLKDLDGCLGVNYFGIVRNNKSRNNKRYLETRVDLLKRKSYIKEAIRLTELKIHELDNKIDRIELEISKELN